MAIMCSRPRTVYGHVRQPGMAAMHVAHARQAQALPKAGFVGGTERSLLPLPPAQHLRFHLYPCFPRLAHPTAQPSSSAPFAHAASALLVIPLPIAQPSAPLPGAWSFRVWPP